MKTQFLTFNAAVERSQVDPLERSRLVAAALALVTAQSVSLPTSPVENPSSHYIASAQQVAEGKLGEYNEGIIFDFKAALAYARMFWLLRYTAAHGGLPAFIGTDYCFFSKLMGADLYVSSDEYCYLNVNKNVLEVLVRAAGELSVACNA